MIHSLTDRGKSVSDVFLLSGRQMERIRPFFPLAHGVARVDDRRILSGIVYVIRNGLQWKDAPKTYDPDKILCNRFIRWNRLGVFDRIFTVLTEQANRPKRLMIDAIHLKAHRTSASLLKKGLSPVISDGQRRPELKAACRVRWSEQACPPSSDSRADQ